MPRRVEVWFVRHGEKEWLELNKRTHDQVLTREGHAKTRKLGERLGTRSRAYTRVFSSGTTPTLQTAANIAHGIRSKGGKVFEGQGIVPLFAQHNPAGGVLEPGAALHISPGMYEDFRENARTGKGGLPSFTKWMEGRFKDAASPERAGSLMANWLARPYAEAQKKGPPLRYVMASHGGSNLEALFYALTGVNAAEVKGKGLVSYAQGFGVIMEGKKVKVEFRNRLFPLYPAWKGILRKASEARRAALIERSIHTMEEQRRMRVQRKKRDSKRRTWKG
ncbi:MAG: histidine phosphatase family protein [Candidatus Diapherotrites archaeon]|nr:histidine phosphatase family protein [Candidatus Diapherotrites archaeon]